MLCTLFLYFPRLECLCLSSKLSRLSWSIGTVAAVQMRFLALRAAVKRTVPAGGAMVAAGAYRAQAPPRRGAAPAAGTLSEAALTRAALRAALPADEDSGPESGIGAGGVKESAHSVRVHEAGAEDGGVRTRLRSAHATPASSGPSTSEVLLHAFPARERGVE